MECERVKFTAVTRRGLATLAQFFHDDCNDDKPPSGTRLQAMPPKVRRELDQALAWIDQECVAEVGP